MKTDYRCLVSIVHFAVLGLLASCAGAPAPAYTPADSGAGTMSVKQARSVLVSGLTGGHLVSAQGYDEDNPDEITDVRVTSERFVVTAKSGNRRVLRFSDLANRLVPGMWTMGGNELTSLGFRADAAIFRNTRVASTTIISAINSLARNAATAREEADAYESSFVVSLPDYRKKAAASDAFPEEVNKYKVQAEGAVHDKDFDDAADLYAEALKVAPWWPAGHFNRALVLGELGEYAMARREMGYYLRLVPDATTARAAQDKIYQWERLESK